MKNNKLLARIDAQMAAMGLSSERQVCDKAGVSVGTLQNMRKKGTSPGVVLLAKLATALNIPIAEAVALMLEDAEEYVPLLSDRGNLGGIDPNIFRVVIVKIEEWLESINAVIPPSEKAELLFRAYDVAKALPPSKFDPAEFPNVFRLRG